LVEDRPAWSNVTAPIGRNDVQRLGFDTRQPINVVRTFTARSCASVTLRVLFNGHVNVWLNGRMVLCSAEQKRDCSFVLATSHDEQGAGSRAIDSTLHLPSFYLNNTGTQVCLVL
jgi:hypothetical protein